jgi:hypothetical protein
MKANSVREVKKHLFNINNIVDEGGDNNKGVAGVLKDRAIPRHKPFNQKSENIGNNIKQSSLK